MSEEQQAKFYQHARQFVEKVIRTRKALIAEGKSKMRQALADKNITEVERYLNYYAYDSNQKMASFWRRKRALVQELLPGASSKCHRKMLDEFDQLDTVAKYIYS